MGPRCRARDLSDARHPDLSDDEASARQDAAPDHRARRAPGARLVGLDGSVPEPSTLSRRQKTGCHHPSPWLKRPAAPAGRHCAGVRHGFKTNGGTRARRAAPTPPDQWRTRRTAQDPLGIDEETLEVRAIDLTGLTSASPILPAPLDRPPGGPGNRQRHGRWCLRHAQLPRYDRCAHAVIPPHKTVAAGACGVALKNTKRATHGPMPDNAAPRNETPHASRYHSPGSLDPMAGQSLIPEPPNSGRHAHYASRGTSPSGEREIAPATRSVQQGLAPCFAIPSAIGRGALHGRCGERLGRLPFDDGLDTSGCRVPPLIPPFGYSGGAQRLGCVQGPGR